MSIVITFSMEPKKRWFGGKVWNQETVKAFASHQADHMGYHFQLMEEIMVFQFCPEGFLWMKWENGKLIGECQTNIAGPGFHAAVIYFLELFAARGELFLDIKDHTGYDKDRDFNKMRRNYFYQWFMELMSDAVERGDQDTGQLVCWPLNYYLPEKQKGIVITHIRNFPLRELRGMVHSGLSMAFAKDFFVWNEEEKDAYYYRNSALVLMNQDCYYMPSIRSADDSRVNHQIIILLEKALEQDPDIPFPKQEYLQLCKLAKRQPVNLEQVENMEIQIGCRKGILYRTLGAVRFALPGNFLYDSSKKGNSDRYYDGLEENGREYYICAVHTSGKAVLQEEVFKRDDIEEVITIEAGGAQGKAARYRSVIKEGRMSYTLSAQLIYRDQLTIISICYTDPSDKDWALNLIRKVQTIE